MRLPAPLFPIAPADREQRSKGISVMRRAIWTHVSLALAPSLAFGFSNPDVTLQGCLDLDCPTSDKPNDAVCDMGMRIADATIVEDILSVPESDTKLSLALTRSPGYLQNTTALMQLTYDYSFWLIQPDDFSPAAPTGDDDDDELQVCGFFFKHLWTAFPMFPYGYNLVDNNDIVNDTFSYSETDDSTKCPAAGLSETCMQSIEDLLSKINVGKNDTRGRWCEAMAEQLEESIEYDANCQGTLTQRAIAVEGRALLGPGAPGRDDESEVGPGDDGFCFPEREGSERFLLAQTITTLDVAQEDDDGNDIIPDVPDPRAGKIGGYLPLMTAQVGKDGKVEGEASFICPRTLDQAYWEENAAGALTPELIWKLAVGLGLAVVASGL